MELCSSGHEEVCYSGRYCPACELIEEIGALKLDIADLESQLEEKNDA